MTTEGSKIILVGDTEVGKSNIMSRFCGEEFKSAIQPTIGVEIMTKVVRVGNKEVKLHIWDNAGLEQYRANIGHLYCGTRGIFIVFDITRRNTFESVGQWIEYFAHYVDIQKVPVILIGNKSDLECNRQVSSHEAEQYAISRKMMYFETSAFNHQNIEYAFNDMVTKIVRQIRF